MNWMTYVLGSVSVWSLASILLGRPWTIIIARRGTPPEVWATGLFLETNMIITGAWTLLFSLATVSSYTMPLWANLILGLAYLIVGRCSSRFAKWYVSKRLNALSRISQ